MRSKKFIDCIIFGKYWWNYFSRWDIVNLLKIFKVVSEYYSIRNPPMTKPTTSFNFLEACQYLTKWLKIFMKVCTVCLNFSDTLKFHTKFSVSSTNQLIYQTSLCNFEYESKYRKSTSNSGGTRFVDYL